MALHLDLVVSESIEINAPTIRVWKTLTDPSLIKEYFFGTETLTDWKVGSEIIFQGEYLGTAYKDKGVVLENIPNQKLVYSYWSSFSGLPDHPDNYANISYNLETIQSGWVRFTWEQVGFSTEAGMEHSKKGMDALLNTIKTIAERRD